MSHYSMITERDRASSQEFLRFAQAEAEKQRLEEDRTEYDGYVAALETENRGSPPVHQVKPVPFQQWCQLMPTDEPNPAIRGQVATSKILLTQVRRTELDAVNSGRRYPAFELPESAKALSVPLEKLTGFLKEQSQSFVSSDPTYYPTRKNFETIRDYLIANQINVPDAATLKAAVDRLRALGMLEERPVPPPSQKPTVNLQVEPDPKWEQQQKRKDYYEKVIARDQRTGEEFTEYEIDRMGSERFRSLAFGDLYQPRVTDVIRPR